MATISIDKPINVFESLYYGASAWLLYENVSLGIAKNDTIVLNEVDAFSVWTGRRMSGTVSKVSSANFATIQKDVNCYYVNPVMKNPWIDYSAISTIVGWSDFTTKIINYRIDGNLLIVAFYITGTSNSTLTNFSIPFMTLSNGLIQISNIQQSDNSTASTVFGKSQIASNSSQIDFYRNPANLAWSNINTKSIRGTIILAVQ